MAFGFMRTIWVVLRAANYTNQAFREVGKNILGLEKAQLQLIQRSRNLLQVGMMFGAMAGMATMALFSLMEKSVYGAAMIEKFSSRMNTSLGKIGTAVAKILEPALNLVVSILEIIADNPALSQLVAILAVAVPVMLAFGAALIFTKAVMEAWSVVMGADLIQKLIKYILHQKIATLGQMRINAAIYQGVGAHMAGAAATRVHANAWVALYMASAYALGMFGAVFTILLALKPIFGDMAPTIYYLTALIIGLATAFMILTGVISLGTLTGVQIAAAGAAASAGAAMAGAVAQTSEYQMGTSFVRKGGLAIVERGEEIISARAGWHPRKAGAGAEAETRKGYPIEQINFETHIDSVQTKADKDELAKEFYKALRKKIDEGEW